MKKKKHFQCNICESRFSQKSNLNTHVRSVHEKISSFKCIICETSFTAKASLNSHLRSVHDQQKPFKCNTCDSSFARKDNLKTHIQSVHEKNTIRCNICGSNFTLKHSLNKYIQAVHDGKKQFKCSKSNIECENSKCSRCNARVYKQSSKINRLYSLDSLKHGAFYSGSH